MAEENKKFCPIQQCCMPGIEPPRQFFCDEEKCEWWIKSMGGIKIENCSIKALAVSQLHISGCLKIK